MTAGLVRRFTGATSGGRQVTVRHRVKGECDEGPGGVGFEFDYWGPQALAEKVEGILTRNELDALALLANLESRWPLVDEDRVTLGRFVSLHIVRTPAFGKWLRALGNKTAKEVLAEAAVKHELDEEQLAPYAERLASPHMHAQTLLRQVNRAASLLLSMHWSIIEFPGDLLIGCDQPVVLIPFACYDFPAEHWRHLRTTNPIESSFATVKLRTKVTKGAGSKKAALAMAYKLLDAAQERWRRFNSHELVTDVLDSVKFKNGIKVTDDETTTTDEKVAA